MKARSGYQVRAVRRTRRAVTIGSTPGHVAPRHATQGCTCGRARAALPILTQVVPGHGHADRRPRREHGEPRHDAARRTGPRRATCAPRRGRRAAASCAWARPPRTAPSHADRQAGGQATPRPCAGAAPRTPGGKEPRWPGVGGRAPRRDGHAA
jgi:hypothetical protein